MLMGYTTTEARRGLRSSQGNIDRAIEFIIEVKKKTTNLQFCKVNN
jgi:UBA/TS-N domain-containing protein